MTVAVSTTNVDPEKLTALAAGRFSGLLLDCGRDSNPGLSDSERWRDWTHQKTTPDQLRIEDYLDLHDLEGCSLLHVGLGNSGLAARFHSQVRRIVGTTVVPAEVERAHSLGFANYRALLHNKYTGAGEGMTGPFDFVIDNNPTTFCCCLTHFAAMLEFYAEALGESGQFVTDRVGLGWTHIPGGNARWSFSFDDFAAVGVIAGLQATRVDRNIYVLSKNPLEPLPPKVRVKWFFRKLGRLLARARR